MNTPILFLLGAFALASLATLVVWIASRPRRERFGHSIETFSRDLNALAPAGSRLPSSSGPQPRRPGGPPHARPGPRPRQSIPQGSPETPGSPRSERPSPDGGGRPRATSDDGR